MIVKSYEKGKFKVYMRMEALDLYTILVINGENSQRIASKEMLFEDASEIYDFVIDTETSNVIDNLKVEVK